MAVLHWFPPSRDRHAARRRTPRLRAAVLCAAALALLPAVPAAAGPDDAGADPAGVDNGELPAGLQQRLAEEFAPVLVFHPLEEYLPTSPLFTLELQDAQGGAGALPLESLGTAVERREQYRAMTLAEKVGLATVYYRAYPARRGSDDVIVLEYWLYYVHNAYRVRGGVLPLWVDSSHPNDLEHIHLVLRRSDTGFVPEEVWASSHAGVVPSNRYRFPGDGGDSAAPLRVLVERGSHAMAPDIDGDGLFTPGVDGSSGYRWHWGIRDRGISLVRYSRAYVDPRREHASLVLMRRDTSAEGALTYGLRPVDDISLAFDALNLSDTERKQVFEVARNWLRRAFGADNGSSQRLLLPPARDHGSATGSIGIESMASTERGFLVGGTFDFHPRGVFVGARYAYLHGGRFLPDVIVEADAVQTVERGYLSTQLLVSYPIDASTRIMAGKALVTDSWRFENRQSDWYAALELRLGSMRVSVAGRTWGPITRLSNEFRLAYFF